MYYSHVVIILFSTGLYKSALFKSAFSTYSSDKTRFSFFCVLVDRVSVSLALNFFFSCFEFSSLILFSFYSIQNNKISKVVLSL